MPFSPNLRYLTSPMQWADLHVIGYCLYAIERAHENLVEILSKTDIDSLSDMPLKNRYELLISAWESIEHVETFRQIIFQPGVEYKRLVAFPRIAPLLETVRILRNNKVHFTDTRKNILKKKTFSSPPYGILKWSFLDLIKSGGKYCEIPLISAEPPLYKVDQDGAITGHRVSIDTARDAYPATVGVSNICLIAFNLHISISNLLKEITELASELEEKFQDLHYSWGSHQPIAIEDISAKPYSVVVRFTPETKLGQ